MSKTVTVITSTSSHEPLKQCSWLNWIMGWCCRPISDNQSVVGIEIKSTLPTIPTFQVERLISKSTFEDMFPHSQVMSQYLWNFFTRYSEKEIGHGLEISTGQLADGAERIYAQITDKEQILFYVKLFANGKSSIGQKAFCDLLLSADELGFIAQKMSGANALGNVTIPMTNFSNGGDINKSNFQDLEENEWIQAVIHSCFHLKEEMSVTFIFNWIQSHLPRAMILLHKYVAYQLAAARAQFTAHDHMLPQTLSLASPPTTISSLEAAKLPVRKDSKLEDTTSISVTDSSSTEASRKRISVTGINPALLWLLEVSLPLGYIATLERKPGPFNCPFTKTLTSQELLAQLRHEGNVSEPWCQLYDSSEEGTSVNRFQLHLYHYKGPTLMFIFAENNYTLCIGCDVEWQESSRFWGGEDSFLLQLQPEFRFIERGPKLLYTNFSIRGYPTGIQIGKDTKNLTLDVKPDFQLVTFKGIPCQINRILAFGCGPKEIKNYQSEYKKWENKQCELQRTVPKRSRSEWSEDTDNYLLGLGGIHTSYVTNGSNGDVYTHANNKTPLRQPARVRSQGHLEYS